MHCLLCQQELVNELTLITLLTGYQTVDEQFCSTCRHAFQPIRKSVCYGCGRMMKTASYCEDCQRWQGLGQVMIQNRALYLYNDQMKDYMVVISLLVTIDYEYFLKLKCKKPFGNG